MCLVMHVVQMWCMYMYMVHLCTYVCLVMHVCVYGAHMSWIWLNLKTSLPIFGIRTQIRPLSQIPHKSAHAPLLIASIPLMMSSVTSTFPYCVITTHVQNNHYKLHCKAADGFSFASHCIVKSHLCYSLQEYLHVTSQISTSLQGLLSFMLVCSRTLSLDYFSII